MLNEAIILAGGFGTRLSSVVEDVPKPMAPVNGKPFLHYLFQQLAETDITRVILAIHHKREVITDFFGDSYLGIEVKYSVEEYALGTGGGIRQALTKCEGEQAIVLNGDSLIDLNLANFTEQFERSNTPMSMALRYMEDVSRYGAVETEGNILTEFKEKGQQKGAGYINSGVYLVQKEYFLNHTPEGNFSMETEFLEPTSKLGVIHTFPSNDYFIDIGIPSDYERAQDEFKRFEDR
jgi:D-glycero-alpha-D-manno-heptose 1-phosphate guanylyltransferase